MATANELCAGEHAFAAVCPTPDPDTMQGEACAAATLASDESWTSLILVTSGYHVHRASILLDRCFGGDIAVVAAHSDAGIVTRIRNVLHEWFASIAAAIGHGVTACPTSTPERTSQGPLFVVGSRGG